MAVTAISVPVRTWLLTTAALNATTPVHVHVISRPATTDRDRKQFCPNMAVLTRTRG
jgi:hypothetical protein